MENDCRVLKLEPSVVTKPWGIVHRQVRDATGIETGLGEFWVASAQTGEGNYSNPVDDAVVSGSMAGLLEQAEREGEEAIRRLLGETAFSALRSTPHRGKTEAWYVREAEGRAGFVCGPRTSEQKTKLQQMVEDQRIPPRFEDWDEETRQLMGVLEPVSAGECYLVPCGTLHTMFALGEDSRLVIDELQEGYGESRLPTLSKILMVENDILSLQVHPCDEMVSRMASGQVSIDQDLQLEPTVRVYDFGRGRNERPDLGFRLTEPEAGLRRTDPVEVGLECGATLTALVVEPHLAKSRLELPAGTTARPSPLTGSYRVLHCLEGEVALQGPANEVVLQKGETGFVPGCAEEGLAIEARPTSTVLDDCVPDVETFRDFLVSRGASAEAFEGISEPPRPV